MSEGSARRSDSSDHHEDNHHSLTRLFQACAALLAFVPYCLFRLPSPDVWWLLAQGRFILSQHQLPVVELFSHTAQGLPWQNDQWLSSLLMVGLFDVGGLNLLHVFKALMLCLTWLMLFDTGLKLRPQPGVAWCTGLLWGVATIQFCHIAYFFDVRAYLFTYFLLSLLWRWLLLERERPLWLWALLIALWSNLHAGVIVGLFLLGLANLLRWSGRWGNGFQTCPSGRALGLLVVASMVNPSGFSIYLHLFKLMGSDWGRYLNEWQSLWKNPSCYGAFPWLVLLWSLILWRSLCPRRYCIISLAFAAVAFSGWRHVTLYGWMTLPLVVAYFPQASLPSGMRERPVMIQILLCLTLLLRPVLASQWSPKMTGAYASLVDWRAYAPCPSCWPLPSGQELSLESRLFPRYAADFLGANRSRLSGRLFNFYGWGGYFIWRLGPQYSIFIDGRAAQVYPIDVYREYLGAAFNKEKLLQVLKSRDIHVAVMMNSSQGEASRSMLAEVPGWKVIYQDDLACILTDEPTPPNGYVIPNSPQNLVQRALGQPNLQAAQRDLAEAAAIDPLYSRTYLVWGVLLLQQGNGAGVDKLLRALAVDPGCPDAHFNLGLFFRRSDRLRAIGEFQAELQLNPSHAGALRELQQLQPGF